MDPDPPQTNDSQPAPLNFIVSYALVSLCWGFTTPFIRRAALKSSSSTDRNSLSPEQTDPSASSPVQPTASSSSSIQSSRSLFQSLRWKVVTALQTAFSIVKQPSYFIPLLLNVTGSVWFFLLLGSAELSVAVPVVNSLAFCWTVLGEWVVERKGIGKETWLGMALVLGGISVCVRAKGK